MTSLSEEFADLLIRLGAGAPITDAERRLLIRVRVCTDRMPLAMSSFLELPDGVTFADAIQLPRLRLVS